MVLIKIPLTHNQDIKFKISKIKILNHLTKIKINTDMESISKHLQIPIMNLNTDLTIKIVSDKQILKIKDKNNNKLHNKINSINKINKKMKMKMNKKIKRKIKIVISHIYHKQPIRVLMILIIKVNNNNHNNNLNINNKKDFTIKINLELINTQILNNFKMVKHKIWELGIIVKINKWKKWIGKIYQK